MNLTRVLRHLFAALENALHGVSERTRAMLRAAIARMETLAAIQRAAA